MNSHVKTWCGGLLLLTMGSSLARADTNFPAANSGSGTNAPANANAAGGVSNEPAYVVVDEAGLWIPVEDLQLTYDVGRQLLLFQQNSDYFIAIAAFEDGPPKLCAFPRVRTHDQGTAWVTNEKNLFFGVRTRSCDGQFFFNRGEKLPVLWETNSFYHVDIERFGRHVEIDLPRSFPHLTYIPAQRSAAELAEEKPKAVAAPPPEKAAPPPKRPVETSPRAVVAPNLPPPIEEMSPILEAPARQVTTIEPPSKTGATAGVEAAETDLSPLPDMSAQPVRSLTMKERLTAAVNRNIWLLELLLALAILAAIPIIIMRNSAALLRRSDAEPPPFEPSPAQVAIVEAQITKKSNDEFSGSLDTFSMGDLIQFIHSTTKTGTLDIQHEGSPTPNRLVFEFGEIIDAMCNGKNGEDAVYAICRIKSGSYTFTKVMPEGGGRTVKKATMSLLLDAHRIMDEEGGEMPRSAPASAPAEPAKPAAPSASGTRKKSSRLSMK